MMWALAAVFWGSFVLGLSGAMMPGPVLTATISEVTKRGFLAGPLIVLGHGVLELLLLAALLAGLDAWLSLDPVRGGLGVIGGLILAAFGLQMIRTAGRTAGDAAAWQPDPREALHGPVLAGGVTTLSNPYWYLWWSTIGLSFAVESRAWGAWGLTAFYGGHILSDLAWFSLVAAAVAKGRRALAPSVYAGVIRACGVVLVLLSALFVTGGLRRLAG
jgi:threonine/homoserine/homoserine lactone efflux protein